MSTKRKLLSIDAQRKLVEKLAETSTDPRFRKMLKRHYLTVPMSEIMAKVPGTSVRQKAAMVGINRATWYVWRSGATRPNIKVAKQLERITGYSVAEIRGVESSP